MSDTAQNLSSSCDQPLLRHNVQAPDTRSGGLAVPQRPGVPGQSVRSCDRTKQQDTPGATSSKISVGASAFLGALWAAVQSYALPAADPVFAIHDQPLSGDVAVTEARARVDWQQETVEADSEDFSDDEDDHEPNAAGQDMSASRQLLYTPIKRWSSVANLPIEEPQTVKVLSAGAMCEAFIKVGILGGKRTTYISKTWALSQEWHGFFSELALYSDSNHLRSLQGDVIPTIIGTYLMEGRITVAMELPHSSFWIEASRDMPHHLKKRCIAAFDKIHARGVLHNDIELRHMLINADGKVIIIDFQESQSLRPNEGLEVAACTAADIRLENRKIRYKLDYDNAVRKETNKMRRVMQRRARNQQRVADLGLLVTADFDPSTVPGYENDDPDDVVNPIVPPQIWSDNWNAAPVDPSCTTVPGQDIKELRRAVAGFIKDNSLLSLDKPHAPTAVRYTQTNVSPTKRKHSSMEESAHSVHDEPPSGLPNFKRRLFFKSQIGADNTCNTTPTTAAKVIDNVPRIDISSISSPMSLRPRSQLIGDNYRPLSTATSEPSTSTLPKEASEGVLNLAEWGATPAPTPIYAPYEGHDGPGGHLVNKPYTDRQLSMLRRTWIRQVTYERCKEEGLEYPVAARTGLCPSTFERDRKPDGKMAKIRCALGAIKRAREDSEDPDGAWDAADRKKARYMACKEALRSEALTAASFFGLEDLNDDDEEEGGPILSDRQLREHLAQVQHIGDTRGRNSSGPSKGILRRHLSDAEKAEQRAYEAELAILQEKVYNDDKLEYEQSKRTAHPPTGTSGLTKNRPKTDDRRDATSGSYRLISNLGKSKVRRANGSSIPHLSSNQVGQPSRPYPLGFRAPIVQPRASRASSSAEGSRFYQEETASFVPQTVRAPVQDEGRPALAYPTFQLPNRSQPNALRRISQKMFNSSGRRHPQVSPSTSHDDDTEDVNTVEDLIQTEPPPCEEKIPGRVLSFKLDGRLKIGRWW